MRRRAVLLGAAISVGVVACELLFPFDGYGPGSPDAGLDGGLEGGGDVDAGPCTLARWPARPDHDDPSDGGPLDLVLVAEGLDLGLSDAGPVNGVDLDEVCTCPGPGSCTGDGVVCDGDGGADHGGNDLLIRLSAFGTVIDQTEINAYVRRGEYSFLLNLKGYNGTANDTSVQLGLYSSDGTTFVDGGILADGGNVAPRFDGTDTWSLNKDSVAGGAGPPYIPKVVDPAAYVADGILVAQVDFPLNLKHALLIQFREGVVVGRLHKDGARWRIDNAIVSGRWPRNNLLDALAIANDPFVKGGHLCGDSGTYQSLKPQICGAADIATAAINDRKGATCDAFALVFAFTASDALMGGIGNAPTLDSGAPCGIDYHDECAHGP